MVLNIIMLSATSERACSTSVKPMRSTTAEAFLRLSIVSAAFIDYLAHRRVSLAYARRLRYRPSLQASRERSNNACVPSCGAGLFQCRGAGQCSGFADECFEVVVEIKAAGTLGEQTFVIGHRCPPVIDGEVGGVEQHSELAADESGGH